MSGIVGIINLDGAPIDRALLHRMTDFLTFRGPDAQHTWVDGHAGFGHALLRTTEESKRERQPFTLDGRIWIVADARVDAQGDLIRKLAAHGEYVEQGATDVELLLRAYRVWGEECSQHLLGDFAFAVWDRFQQHLFCARDHLGVKPFFYAHLGQTVIFSNTLDCVRQHPAVSDKLNDLAIADFLLFDLNQNPATTSFADIQRIPPAHRAAWSGSGLRMSRYWTLPVDEPIYFKKPDDYTDRFKELLDAAVRDRLRTNNIAVLMSGGLDSPTLAATACKMLRGWSTDSEVRAFTTVVDGLDGNERYYAGLVAQRLRIPIHFWDVGARAIDPDWQETRIHTAEPCADPTNLAAGFEECRFIAAHSRVLFYGEGPDNALHYEWRPYLSYLTRKRDFGRLAVDIGGHVIRHRRVPLLPTIPRMLKDWVKKDRWRPSFPNWLDEGFESRMWLRARMDEHRCLPLPLHPIRPVGYRSFHTPLWQALFSKLDAGTMSVAVETRHPFVDLRLLRYMLSVPAIPWCRAKHLERRAMSGVLPDPVLRRPKSPLTSDPAWQHARHSGFPPLRPAPALGKYVNVERVAGGAGDDMALFQMNFRPFALNYWLQNLRREPRNFVQEESNNEFARKRAE